MTESAVEKWVVEEGIVIPKIKPRVSEERTVPVEEPRAAKEGVAEERISKPERYRNAHARHKRIIDKRVVERIVEDRVMDSEIAEPRRAPVHNIYVTPICAVVASVVIAAIIVGVHVVPAIILHRGELCVTSRQARHGDEHRHDCGNVPEKPGSSFEGSIHDIPRACKLASGEQFHWFVSCYTRLATEMFTPNLHEKGFYDSGCHP
jgi:hypothetical protein